MERLRIGIIGTGKIAKHHAAAYKYSGKAELYAASDIDQATLNAYCDEHSISRRYTDYGKMLSLDELDAVSVCVPPYLHAPITIDALRAGKHVLCEKPMCCTVEEAEQMVAAAKEANCLLQIYYRYRFGNAHRKAKELIQAGELGNIYLVKATGYRFRGRPILDNGNASRWFIDP